MIDTKQWIQVKALFEEAVQLPRDARDAFLRRACPDDVTVREEVLSLLAADETSRGAYLDQPIAIQSPIGSLIGATIGPYCIRRELGSGGMAVVYLAEREGDDFNQKAAVKILKQGLDSQFLLSRFQNERRILADLDHPNIARLIDGGAMPDGRPYFIMEYVEGLPLNQYCNSSGPALRQRLELMQRICEAVSFAHRNLIVHRDLKPENILVTAEGRPILLDFGIAKVLDAGEGGSANQTITRMRMMTPAYAAPEQVSGGPITTACDVYALGVLLYELLTGSRLFGTGAEEGFDLARRILEEEPVKPSLRVARDGGNDPTTAKRTSRVLAGDLDNIVLKAVQKDPARRYQSPADLGQDLARYLNGFPVEARGEAWRYRCGKFVRRNLAAVGAAAAIVLMILGFSVTLWRQNRRVVEERDRAEAALRQSRESLVRAEAVTSFLKDLFKVADPTENNGAEITVQEILDKGSRQIERKLSDQPGVRAQLMATMGVVNRNMGRYEQAGPLLEAALAYSRANADPDSDDVAGILLDLSILAQEQGHYEKSEALVKESLALRIKHDGPRHERVADARQNLGVVHTYQGDNQAAGDQLALAEEIYRELGVNSVEFIQCLNNLGNLANTSGDYPQARAYLEDAVSRMRKRLGADVADPDLQVMLQNLGLTYYFLDDLAAADRLYAQSVAMGRDLYQGDHLTLARGLTSLGHILLVEGRYQDAVAAMTEATAMYKRLFGDDHAEVGTAVTNLAGALQTIGDYDGAEPLFEEGLKIRRRLLGEHHRSVANSYNNLGYLRVLKKDYEAAGRNLEKALAIQEASGEETGLRGTTLVNIGRSLQGRQRYDEALTYYDKALELMRRVLGARHSHVAGVLHSKGTLYLERGDLVRAEELFLEALKIREDVLPQGHPYFGRSYHDLALLYQAMGRMDDARTMVAKALAVRTEKLSPSHPERIETQALSARLAPIQHQ